MNSPTASGLASKQSEILCLWRYKKLPPEPCSACSAHTWRMWYLNLKWVISGSICTNFLGIKIPLDLFPKNPSNQVKYHNIKRFYIKFVFHFCYMGVQKFRLFYSLNRQPKQPRWPTME